MIDWIKRYFAVDNSVNENTVNGTFLIVCGVVAGFCGYPEATFIGFLTGGLLCFGISLKKQ